MLLNGMLDLLLKTEEEDDETEWNAMPEFQRTRILQSLEAAKNGNVIPDEEVWAQVDQMMKG